MIAAADLQQRQAAAPEASVWVAASAGTGKTKVLTDRLLALMLAGTDPARLLCLTFTRAAAAEMANRLNAQLARWATAPPGALAQELEQLTGWLPDAALMAGARRLFARVLDTPGGIKIATIHAFCQSLLRRFPLEAGVAPEFAVLDERSAGEALAEAGEAVILQARNGPDSGLAEALTVVARWAAEERFAELLGALAAERLKLRRLAAEGAAVLQARLCAALDLPVTATPEGLVEAFCVAPVLDAAPAPAAVAWRVALPHDRPDLLDAYLDVFLTQKSQIRDKHSGNAEAQRAFDFDQARRKLAIVEATLAILRLGEALLAAYDERKRRQGALDYDDLVVEALALLERRAVAPWILYKLDGGLDHILIDEAQDTNPEQWQIVAALAEEFFAGDGARQRPRTIFAVGDTKQSIFSFQRADPEAFIAMRRHFEAKVIAAKQDWQIVPLEISFRSTAPVLAAVDAIFGPAAARDGVALDGSPIRHVASREGQAGLVELWPPVKPDPEEPDLTALPVTRQKTVEPRTRLAQALATRIKDWLDNAEQLPARGRAVRAGDVMVLVRRRNQFVSDLVRALKSRGVPVAGADRLILKDQLAVQDLIALGRFLLLPEDDLNLATVLKGPLIGWGEEALFDLAWGRRKEERLWDRLRAQAGDRLDCHAAAALLSSLLARADFVPPYELYAGILGAAGGRRLLLERLGPEAADPIDEFLALALAYEREHVPSLQGFLRWLDAGDSEVKRDLAAQQRDEVRILTVHGAKGLEAPIVFLPDTMALPEWPKGPLWSTRDGQPLPFWCPRTPLADTVYAAARQAQRRRQLQEYRRLLYVALTRAQDRLYICGWETRRPAGADCWYALCRQGLEGLAAPFDFAAAGWGGEGWRLSGAQTAAPVRAAGLPAAGGGRKLPLWVAEKAPAEPEPPTPLAPSRPAGSEPATLSPLAVAGRDRFKRGLIVHRLLQGLPDLPAAERDGAARRFLALPLHGLGADEQAEIRAATLAVLDDPDFAPLFGPNSRAEVPLTGLVRGHAVAGQIDRLVVEPGRVLIVDYKTVRPPPRTEAEVAPVYLRQLAIYRAALLQIFPAHEIACALLWTEAPLLLPISPARLDAHLP